MTMIEDDEEVKISLVAGVRDTEHLLQKFLLIDESLKLMSNVY